MSSPSLKDPPSFLYLDATYGLHYPDGMSYTEGAPKDLLEFAHPHWSSFPPVHPAIQHFLGISFFFLWIINFVGNGLVMYIFLMIKSLRTPSNMLVVSLALSDFIMMGVLVPPVVVNMFISRWWVFGEPFCNLYGFMGGVFGTCSLVIIILIGYDRYNVIVRGLSGNKITPGMAAAMILFAFGYSFGVCLPAYFKVWGRFTVEGLLLTCSFDYVTDTWNNKSYTIFICFFSFVLPLIFVLFFYGQIVVAVIRHERALRAQARKMNVESLRSKQNSSSDSAEIRTAKVALTNVTVWFIAWSPYAFVCFFAQFGGLPYVTPLVSQLPAFFAKTASMFNPVIYAISHPKYREALSTEVPCLGIKDPNKNNEDGTKTVIVPT